jgi:hypothetical protein
VQAMRSPVLVQVGTPKLETGRGMHRFVWDMAHPGPWDASARRSGRNGPMAVPGRYQVRLSAGDWSQTHPLELRIDPRVAADGVMQADLEAQLALNLQIRDLLTRARLAAARVEGLVEREPRNEALRELHRQLITLEEGSYQQPMLVDQIGYLYRLTTGADQRPGRDAYQRYQELEAELERVERQAIGNRQ